jgi:ATP-dependent DNA helicase RecG
MFEHMLIEGKRPPVIREVGESVCVNFQRQEVSAPFRAFVAEESNRGRLLTVDQLLVLQYLLEHVELDTPAAARLCQRDEATMRDALGRMETQLGYLERGGTGRGTYWTLRPVSRRHAAGYGVVGPDAALTGRCDRICIASMRGPAIRSGTAASTGRRPRPAC